MWFDCFCIPVWYLKDHLTLLTTCGRQYTATDNLIADNDDYHGVKDGGEDERTMVKTIAKYHRYSDDYNIYDNDYDDEQAYSLLTHWGRVTHICVGKLSIIGSDNGLSPGRRQAIIWNNAGILLIGPLGTNFSDILIVIHTFSS